MAEETRRSVAELSEEADDLSDEVLLDYVMGLTLDSDVELDLGRIRQHLDEYDELQVEQRRYLTHLYVLTGRNSKRRIPTLSRFLANS